MHSPRHVVFAPMEVLVPDLFGHWPACLGRHLLPCFVLLLALLLGTFSRLLSASRFHILGRRQLTLQLHHLGFHGHNFVVNCLGPHERPLCLHECLPLLGHDGQFLCSDG